MKQGLDEFLAGYNVTLLGTKPYSKGSTSQAESTIRLVKQALCQLCLSNTHRWPELLPLMLAGLNSQPLQNTGVSKLVKVRTNNLYKRKRLDTTEYQLNGLVIGHNVPVTAQKGQSLELQPTANGFYYHTYK